jgi:hypothetical protein
MHDELWCEAEEDVFKDANGKSEAGPVVPVLQNLQGIAIELNVAVKVHVLESLHGDLVPAAVPDLIGIALEGKVMFDGAPWELDLVVLARAEGRYSGPECDQNRDGGEETKEDGGLQSAADFP